MVLCQVAIEEDWRGILTVPPSRNLLRIGILLHHHLQIFPFQVLCPFLEVVLENLEGLLV